jgi:predicted acetyltransferase
MLSRLLLIQAGPDHQAVLENLLELYIHDFSEIVPVDVGEDGRFGYRDLPLYWSETNHHAVLARLEDKLAGFALVRQVPDAFGDGEAWDMAEFFVLRRYRHRGVGTALTESVWKQFPGAWQIRVRAENLSARHFWRSAIAKFTGSPADSGDFFTEGVVWHRFTFQSPPLT